MLADFGEPSGESLCEAAVGVGEVDVEEEEEKEKFFSLLVTITGRCNFIGVSCSWNGMQKGKGGSGKRETLARGGRVVFCFFFFLINAFRSRLHLFFFVFTLYRA